VRITSAQPQIVDNERGLLIDFNILATQVGNQSLLPSLTVKPWGHSERRTCLGAMAFQFVSAGALRQLFGDL